MKIVKGGKYGGTDAEWRDVLQRGSPSIDAPDEARERVYARLAASLPLAPNDGGGSNGGPAGVARPSGARHPTQARGSSSFRPLSAKAMASVSLGLGLVGGLVVWGSHFDRSPEATNPREMGAQLATSGAVDVPTGRPNQEIDAPNAVDRRAPSPPVSVFPAPRVTRSGTKESSANGERSSSPASSANLERALVDDARKALANEDATTCIARLQEHRARYPRGILREEREALSVRALVVLGRYDEARARGHKFLDQYPNSLMRSAVEAALRDASSKP